MNEVVSLEPALAARLPRHAPLVVSTRGGAVENVHYGSYVVVDGQGRRLAAAGDADFPVFTRSALKPFQALPLVAHPRFAELGLTRTEIALLCASHNGEPRHAEAARALLARAGLTEAALQCGVHTPYWYAHNDTRPPEGARWSALHHNCSGKHSGMLLLAWLEGADPARYLERDHPVQRRIAEAVAYAAGELDAEAMTWGTDGCSAPNYALPLAGLARAAAWLTRPNPDPRYGEAPRIIFDAMVTHPEMVSGEGRHDLDYALAGGGDWISKVGAEGVQILASRRHGAALAVKIADGSPKALTVATCAVLCRLGWVDPAQAEHLARWASFPIRSIRGVEVGRLSALL
ncbi:MAG: asparaginase [Casimicrobiaceae bacterium]